MELPLDIRERLVQVTNWVEELRMAEIAAGSGSYKNWTEANEGISNVRKRIEEVGTWLDQVLDESGVGSLLDRFEDMCERYGEDFMLKDHSSTSMGGLKQVMEGFCDPQIQDLKFIKVFGGTRALYETISRLGCLYAGRYEKAKLFYQILAPNDDRVAEIEPDYEERAVDVVWEQENSRWINFGLKRRLRKIVKLGVAASLATPFTLSVVGEVQEAKAHEGVWKRLGVNQEEERVIITATPPGNVNVRFGPGVAFESQGQIPARTEIDLVRRAEINGEPWVQLSGGEWVAAWLLNYRDRPLIESEEFMELKDVTWEVSTVIGMGGRLERSLLVKPYLRLADVIAGVENLIQAGVPVEKILSMELVGEREDGALLLVPEDDMSESVAVWVSYQEGGEGYSAYLPAPQALNLIKGDEGAGARWKQGQGEAGTGLLTQEGRVVAVVNISGVYEQMSSGGRLDEAYKGQSIDFEVEVGESEQIIIDWKEMRVRVGNREAKVEAGEDGRWVVREFLEAAKDFEILEEGKVLTYSHNGTDFRISVRGFPVVFSDIDTEAIKERQDILGLDFGPEMNVEFETMAEMRSREGTDEMKDYHYFWLQDWQGKPFVRMARVLGGKWKPGMPHIIIALDEGAANKVYENDKEISNAISRAYLRALKGYSMNSDDPYVISEETVKAWLDRKDSQKWNFADIDVKRQ